MISCTTICAIRRYGQVWHAAIFIADSSTWRHWGVYGPVRTITIILVGKIVRRGSRLPAIASSHSRVWAVLICSRKHIIATGTHLPLSAHLAPAHRHPCLLPGPLSRGLHVSPLALLLPPSLRSLFHSPPVVLSGLADTWSLE